MSKLHIGARVRLTGLSPNDKMYGREGEIYSVSEPHEDGSVFWRVRYDDEKLQESTGGWLESSLELIESKPNLLLEWLAQNKNGEKGISNGYQKI